MNQSSDTVVRLRDASRRKWRVYGYICSRTSAAAAAGYRQDMTCLVRRNGFDERHLSVGDGSCLDSLLAIIDRQDGPPPVVIVPSLDHLDGRLPEVASHVTVWTMYPPQCWGAEQQP